jgi:glycosyltransferase involved in cell wall biosynthesis
MTVEVMPNPSIRWPGDLSSLPRISIVTPCYNHAEFIEATMRSVLEQGYPNLEYIVMDGGSPDGSAAIIEKYASYLAHWQSQPDGGQYDAINQGFQRSTGEIMAWINSDDMLHRNALWTVVEVFQQFPQIEWLIGCPTLYSSNGCTVAAMMKRQLPRWSRYRFLYDHRWIQQESVVWRRSLWEKAGGFVSTEYKHAGDFELWARFFRYGELYTTTALVGGFRISANQKTRVVRDIYEGEVEQIRAQEVLSPTDRTILARIRFFRRWFARLIWKSDHVRRLYNSQFKYPPLVSYNLQRDEFELLDYSD